jgi:hypothetical protein
MEILEVFRRWMWIFFRVEAEWGLLPLILSPLSLLTMLVVRNNRGPDPDDILLGEFGGKIDED